MLGQELGLAPRSGYGFKLKSGATASRDDHSLDSGPLAGQCPLSRGLRQLCRQVWTSPRLVGQGSFDPTRKW